MRNDHFLTRVSAFLGAATPQPAGETPGDPLRASDALYTEGCRELLLVQAELLRARRRLRAALAQDGTDSPDAGRVRELSLQVETLTDELSELRVQLRRLAPGRV